MKEFVNFAAGVVFIIMAVWGSYVVVSKIGGGVSRASGAAASDFAHDGDAASCCLIPANRGLRGYK
jgi:hypothetical protein